MDESDPEAGDEEDGGRGDRDFVVDDEAQSGESDSDGERRDEGEEEMANRGMKSAFWEKELKPGVEEEILRMVAIIEAMPRGWTQRGVGAQIG